MNELEKGFPRIDYAICGDANEFINSFANQISEINSDTSEWKEFLLDIRSNLHGPDSANQAQGNYLELHGFINNLSKTLKDNDLIASCSSGGTFNAVMQVFENKKNQKVLSNKGSASMGYGLAGAIGMAFAYRNNRVIHFEGDGGFAQNMQDIGTVANNKLNIKMFISSNKGYASIRTTQKSYFSGNYLGCDSETGLGLPEWEFIFKAYEIPVIKLNAENLNSEIFNESMETSGPCAFILDLDPEQLYFPKLTSKLKDDGSMETNPLHLMSPSLSEGVSDKYLKYLSPELRK
jgi:acetolactate synthase-1/2/3 large subunit